MSDFYAFTNLSGEMTDSVEHLEELKVKAKLATMLKGGVIMDVVNPDQARIAEEAGACAVIAIERVPADIRRDGGVARMSDPRLIKDIIEAITIPVIAIVRIGHFVEAKLIEAIGADYIDESEVLAPADDTYHIAKHLYKVPFMCGACNLSQALRRISEGAAVIRTKGEAGTGDVIQAVKHMRKINGQIRHAQTLDHIQLYNFAKELNVNIDHLRETARLGHLPVANFAAGGIATPADAVMMMMLGCDGVIIGSGIFKSANPAKRASAIVKAVANYKDANILATVSEDLGDAMVGINTNALADIERLERRGY
ncbi:Pyridoxal 5'-phosphate synthase subunit snz1 [Coemansia sp. RSA 1200]|nr:Pyridoxal 5'-phosphate synthase subunit snz1 [Coemansia sp. RSA 1200]